MLLKEIMVRTGARTKEAKASDMGASPASTSSVTLTRTLLNPGSLSLLLNVLAYLADCPRVSGRHEAPPSSPRHAGSLVASCKLLVAADGSSRMGPGPPAVGEWSLSHWTSGEVPGVL